MNIITLSVGDRHVHYECFALSPGSYSTLAASPITAARSYRGQGKANRPVQRTMLVSVGE